jgi:uncharacterized protein (DUF58 family)
MDGFVPFLLILFVLAVILRVESFFTIFYLFAGVYLLSRFWVGRIKRSLRAEACFASRVFPGDRVTIELTVKNTGWLPIPWIEVIEPLPAELTPPWQPDLMHLSPNEAQTVSYSFTPRKRGYYRIGPLKVSTGEVFGIVPRFRKQFSPDYLTVYPRIVPLQDLGLPTRSPLAALPSKWPLFEDTSRVIGMRPYESGDSPRAIHWTASASAGQLLVKRYQAAVARDTLIFLDLNVDNYRELIAGPELAIICAASIAYHIAIREGLPVGLAMQAEDPLTAAQETFHLPPRSERAHLMHLLEVLARVSPTHDSSFTGQLRRERAHLVYGTTLVVITGREDTDLFDTLILLLRAGFAIALIVVQPRRIPGKTINLPRGIMVYRVWGERDLETKI